jgi:DNA-binding CsgD family transcriptional regulator
MSGNVRQASARAPAAQTSADFGQGSGGARAAQEADLAVKGLTDAAGHDLESLSPSERQILVMVAKGATSASIGEELHLSPKTVDTYRSRLMAKLGLGDVSAIVRWAIRHQLIGLEEL